MSSRRSGVRARAHRRGGLWLLCVLTLAGAATAEPKSAQEAQDAPACVRPPAGAEAAAGDTVSLTASFEASLEAQNDATRLLLQGNRESARGEHEAALASYRESAQAAATQGDAGAVALANANAGRAALDAGHADDVEPALERARTGLDELPEATARAALLLHVGRTEARLAEADPNRRRAATRRAADAFGRAISATDPDQPSRLRSYGQGYLGELYSRHGGLDDAITLTRRALSAGEAANAPDAVFRWQLQLARLEQRSGRDSPALQSYRQALSTLAGIDTSSGDDTGEFEREVEGFYDSFVDALLVASIAASDEQSRQRLLVEARDALEDRKTAELIDYFRDPCLDAQRKTTPDDIPGTVVVYPILLPDRTELIVSRGGVLARFTVPVDTTTLIAEVRAFREALERRNSRAYLRHSYQLYAWLIAPIESELEFEDQTEPPTLVFVPDGALRTIPFGALRDRSSKQYLIQKHPIAVTPSLTLTDPRPIESENVRMLAAGISDAIGGFSALEAVETELAAVRELYPGRTLLNGSFGVAQLRAELRDIPYGIVHIASHGEFGGAIEDNFLLAYDGQVSMDSLAAFVAATRFRTEEPLELLTLSACESAAGDDRAALGLAGVALRAGARSALATLWSVNDRATAELVISFYGELRKPGMSRAKALQTAQIRMLTTRHYRHPGYWAPFLLISSWL